MFPEALRFIHATEANIFMVESHQKFSQCVSEYFIPEGCIISPDSKYNIVAVCAYPPNFFYKKIRKSIEIMSTQPGDKRAAPPARTKIDIIKDYEKTCDELSFSDIDPTRDFQEARNIFMDGARKEFPHFISMVSSKKKISPRPIRLCIFKKEIKKFHNGMCDAEIYKEGHQYMERLRKSFEKHEAYAFFNWLNGDCPCLIIKPIFWEDWGIHPDNVRDFAIFGHTQLVDYPDVKVMVHVNPLNDSWRFIEEDKFRKEIENEDRVKVWNVNEFMDKLYGSKSKLKEKLLATINGLNKLSDKKLPAGKEYVVKRKEYCSELIELIRNEDDESKLKIIMDTEPFKSCPNSKKICLKYREKRKDTLNEIGFIIRKVKGHE